MLSANPNLSPIVTPTPLHSSTHLEPKISHFLDFALEVVDPVGNAEDAAGGVLIEYRVYFQICPYSSYLR